MVVFQTIARVFHPLLKPEPLNCYDIPTHVLRRDNMCVETLDSRSVRIMRSLFIQLTITECLPHEATLRPEAGLEYLFVCRDVEFQRSAHHLACERQ